MATYSDGVVNHGDISVTLSTLGAVIIEGFTTTRPSTNIRQRNATGEPLKQKFIDDYVTASGVVQIPSAGGIVARFETFSYTPNGGSAETWIVTKAGETHSMTDYDKCQCDFAKKYN